MAITTINPPELHTPEGYVHVTVARGGSTIRVSGQTAVDGEGRLIADDLAGQTAATIHNVVLALAAAGATPGDVVSSTLLVVDWSPGRVEELMTGAMRAAAAGEVIVTATTLIAVTALSIEGALIEISVEAVVA